MPTGLTGPIYEGETVSARDFLLRCSRQFGATAHMRDEPLAVMPRLKETDLSYYYKQIEAAEKRIAEIQDTDIVQLQAEYDEDYQEAIKQVERIRANKEQVQERYEKLRYEVADWVPPTEDHVYLKEFALQQLEDSIRADCAPSIYSEPKRKIATDQKEKEIEYLQADIQRYTQTIEETKERDENHNAWITKLYMSLPE